MVDKKEPRFEDEHWLTQKKEDEDLKPSGCAWCGCKVLIDVLSGWMCNDCNEIIHAVSYYQGANGKAQIQKSHQAKRDAWILEEMKEKKKGIDVPIGLRTIVRYEYDKFMEELKKLLGVRK